MDPGVFIRKPVRWLNAISRYRGTGSAAPDSACDEQKAHLDLSSWRLALNGSEPVRPRTIESFARAFASCGFH
jgi:acyl-CoA synthetase (AMP-forming)/AMP-acid ligase II